MRTSRLKFNGKWYTKKSGHFHKKLAEEASINLRKKGYSTRIVERKSAYSGLEIFDLYFRRKQR